MEGDRSEDLESIKKEVDQQHHVVVDLIKSAYKEMKSFGPSRSPTPNIESIIDMLRTQGRPINEFFRFLKISDKYNDHLIVNDELVIEVKAFLQMTQEERDLLIEETKKLKDSKNFEKLSTYVNLVCSKYRLQFEKQRKDGIQKILKAFRVQSREELTFGVIKFANLEQHNLDAVIKVFRESGKEYNEKCSQVIKKMADRFEVDNVQDFAAVAEFAVRRINEEIKSLQEKNRNPPDIQPERNPQWTQDGTSLCWQNRLDDGTIAVRYDNLNERKAVIATLYVKKPAK